MHSDSIAWFYAVPLVVFGPMLFALWWVVGGKTLFKPTQEAKEYKQKLKDENFRVAEEQRKKRERIKSIKKDRMVGTPLRWAAQALAYCLFAATLAAFGAAGGRVSAPVFTPTPPEMAVIKLSMNHPGKHQEACKGLSAEELAKLPSNLRKVSCTRRRWPVTVEIEMDGRKVYDRTANPAGLAGDGSSNFYARFLVPPGTHHLITRVRDIGDSKDFQYVHEDGVTVEARQILVIGILPGANEIYYH